MKSKFTMIFCCSYLNTTFIKKQKFTEADLNYGGFPVDLGKQMLEIGEVSANTLYLVILRKQFYREICLKQGRSLLEPCTWYTSTEKCV